MTIEPSTALSPDREPTREPEAVAEKGNWFHRHRSFTKEPITYAGYQMFRSAAATIPYGLGMATVHRAMGFLRIWGEKNGLKGANAAAGIVAHDAKMEAASKAAASALKLEGAAAAEMNATVKTLRAGYEAAQVAGGKGAFARNVARFAGSPINQAIQIGVSFTMFRFVGGLIKGQRDKVMNEKNTAEDTNRESKNWWRNIKDMAKTNWTAESTGTPVAALTLGFASANFKPFGNNVPKLNPGETFNQGFKRAVLHPEAKLLQNAAIWTIAYSIFFEAAERIFKDMQLKRGKWEGNANSLKNIPNDPTVGGYSPGKTGYAADGHTDEFHHTAPPPKPKLDILTGDPSVCRFLFRRVLPVAVGITGYAIAKRSTYLSVGGGMLPVAHEMTQPGKLVENLKGWGGDAWREGAATGTFGVLWMATDAWGTWYDKFFAKMQDKASHQQMTEHQSKNLGDLHEKLLAKEQAQGRVA